MTGSVVRDNWTLMGNNFRAFFNWRTVMEWLFFDGVVYLFGIMYVAMTATVPEREKNRAYYRLPDASSTGDNGVN